MWNWYSTRMNYIHPVPWAPTGHPWEDLRHRQRSTAGLLVGHEQILASSVNQILAVEVFLHKGIKTQNQVQRQWRWLEWQSDSPLRLFLVYVPEFVINFWIWISGNSLSCPQGWELPLLTVVITLALGLPPTWRFSTSALCPAALGRPPTFSLLRAKVGLGLQ